MKLRELRELVGLHPPELSAQRRRLSRCHDIEDMRRIARRRIPRAVFDYVEGGADDELTLRRNREAFLRYEFVPHNLRDVSGADPTTVLFGERLPLPLVFSPTGYTRMIDPAGEAGVARAARRAGIPYGLSTVASTSIDELAATGHPNLWFQLYVWRDRGLVMDLVARARAYGYRVLEVSVDVPVSGNRARDVRNGLTIPPRLTARALADIARHPAWWVRMVRAPVVRFANAPSGVGAGVTIEDMTAQFDPSVDWRDLEQIRAAWAGPLVLKGTIGPDDARLALEAGVDGLHLSNHGGRQLDRTVPPLELLPSVRETVGDDLPIIVDSGLRHGADVAIAVALGADAAAIGRAYLYGLMAAGEAGVDRVAELFATQFRRTMQLLGVASVEELRAAGAELLRRRRERVG